MTINYLKLIDTEKIDRQTEIEDEYREKIDIEEYYEFLSFTKFFMYTIQKTFQGQNCSFPLLGDFPERILSILEKAPNQ